MNPSHPIQILPSIATGDLMNLESEVRKLEVAGVDAIHFDVMDGHFVPLLTIGVPMVEQMKKITKLPLDVHIMVTNPDAVFESYLEAGADTLTFHIEAATHAHRICAKIREAKRKAGLALNPATHWRDIEFLLPFLDVVVVMCVNPGYSRQAHIPEMLEKVKQLSEFRAKQELSFEIQVDGGVNASNIALLKQAGANIFVAGGAIFNQSDYGAAVRALRANV